MSVDTLPARADQRLRPHVGAERHASGAAALPDCEFLSFKLGAGDYGIEILRVQEIRSYEPPTRIASAPANVRGVIDLRGVIVPIVDLRAVFGVVEPSFGPTTAVIMLNVLDRTVGVVVDAVADVVTFDAAHLHDVPPFAADVPVDHLRGVGTLGDRLFVLLNIERLISNQGLGVAEIH